MIYVISFVTFLLGGFVMFLWAKKAMDRDNFLFVLKLEKGLENERQRIASELHDNLIQRLAALRLRLVHLLLFSHRPETEMEIKYVRDALEKSVYEIRKLIANELCPYFAEDSMHKLIADLCKTLDNIIGWKIIFQSSTAEREFYIEPEVKKELYRITQQILQNAITHSLGSTITLTLEWTDHLLIIIEDDGHGYLRNRDGIGKLTLQKKAEQIGATLKVSSGFRGVTAELKLKKKLGG